MSTYVLQILQPQKELGAYSSRIGGAACQDSLPGNRFAGSTDPVARTPARVCIARILGQRDISAKASLLGDNRGTAPS